MEQIEVILTFMNRILSLLTFILMLSSMVSAQSWTSQSEEKLSFSGIQDFHPIKSIVAKVSDAEIKEILWSAPYEDQSTAIDSRAILKLMMADGRMLSFGIVRYDMQEPLLAAKFDNIRTFKGVCLSDRKIRVRLDYTVHGLRAVVNSPGSHIYIEHFKRGHKNYKIIYDRRDYRSTETFTCGVTEQKIDRSRDPIVANVRQGSCELNTLRLANAANGEYSNFHTTNASIPDEEEVHSAVVTAINRVNEVYEQEFGVRMVLVNNNESLYYYNSGTDPYTNGSGGTMLGQNQNTVDDVIGTANYDIGHVFSTGGGGVAYLSSVCNNNQKAGGVTGQSSPIGDPFSIDYVAHEMGHQMGANHTQNNDCNRNSNTAMEPGSASTIMGYAGICAPNVQSNSDPYFHAISIDEVMNDASVFACAEEIINFGNTSPEVTLDASSYAIPKSTTFVLDANGTDLDGDDITYCWEQMDDEVATMPPSSTNTGGPAFRSLEPVSDSKRYFPSLPDIIAGNSPEWEVIPSVGRDLNFRVTVRDWHDGPGTSDAGCTAEADVVIEVDGNSGPFVVTSQSSNVTWELGQNETITWDVANTNGAPVNCTNVEIWFSEDENFDAPILLTTTANDGSSTIVVPSIITSTGRVMVKGADNIFFDINEGEITIEQNTPTYEMSLSVSTQNFCNTVNSTSTNVQVSSILGYNTLVALSISGLPTGAVASFSSNPVIPGNISVLTISGFTGEVGQYDIIIEGQSGGEVKSVNYELILTGPATPPEDIYPTDGAVGVSLMPTLIWEDVLAMSYDYQFSSFGNGASIIQSGTVTDNQVEITNPLEELTAYGYRVRSNNGCGTSAWSDIHKFTTNAIVCQTLASSDLPMTISSTGQNTISSELVLYDRGTIDDIDIVNLEGTHSYVDDLSFSLVAPDNTNVEFWNKPCGSQDDFDINFDDESSLVNHPCPPIDGDTYQPDNPLSDFDNKAIAGIWQLEILDDADQDGGELTGWGLKFCMDDYCDLTVSNNQATVGIGTFLGALDCARSGDTIRLMTDIAGLSINLTNVITINKNINVLADPADDITINFINTDGGLIIDDMSDVSFEGFTMQSNGTAPTLMNNGSLKLTDINVLHPNDSQVINSNTGALEINGQCNIQD